MNRHDQLAIFQAQVKNVKEIDKAWKQIGRSINSDLRKNNEVAVKRNTKILSLIYCAWSEAIFSKLIHTPHGFEIHEIIEIKKHYSKSIVKAWEKCIEIATSKINSKKSNYVPNIKQKLNQLIALYIREPSQTRNKIAHGQWIEALNCENTAINDKITREIEALDIVKLNNLREACRGLCKIVEALIESPEHTFHRDYWIILGELENHLEKTAKFSLAEKVKRLKAKEPRRKDHIMNNPNINKVIEQLQTMPQDLQQRVLEFARSLENEQIRGTSGSNSLPCAGSIAPEDLKLVSEPIDPVESPDIISRSSRI